MGAQNLINQLSPADKKIFALIIAKAEEKDKHEVYKLIEENPEFLKIMIDNYKEKLEAFKSGDSNKLQQIIDKEVKMVEKMAKK